MFDFQKLTVYQKAVDFFASISKSIIRKKIADRFANDQLRRASMSISLNIAEGSSRFSNADRRHFYTIARGSIYECVAIIDLLHRDELIDDISKIDFSANALEISKMLYTLERQLKE